jgi:hypothetical protein
MPLAHHSSQVPAEFAALLTGTGGAHGAGTMIVASPDSGGLFHQSPPLGFEPATRLSPATVAQGQSRLAQP